MEGLESGMRDVMAALSGLGSKMERLAELSLATQKAGLATAASVEVGLCCFNFFPGGLTIVNSTH